MIDPQATGLMLKRAQYRNHRAIENALAPLGTTLAQWNALRAIASAPDSPAHDLAVATFQSDQAFGTLGNRLEIQGLIERTAGKGRRVEHRITAAGKKLLDASNVVALRVSTRSLSRLTKAEIATLHDLLLRIVETPED